MNTTVREHSNAETQGRISDEIGSLACIRESCRAEAETGQGSGPIYRRLAECIRGLIENNTLENGTRLPNVRDLADALELSKGTVKHAYNLLENEGLLSLTQGKGSFVFFEEPGQTREFSRKERAMHIIDQMLDQLEELNFSRREMQIFLELKLRERDAHGHDLKVVVFSDTPEERSVMMNALASIPGIELFAYPSEDILMGRVDVNAFDAFIAPEPSYRALKMRLMGKEGPELILMGFYPGPHTVIALSRLPQDSRVGILSLSKTYAGKMAEVCENFASLKSRPGVHLFHETDTKLFLKAHDVVIVPANYFSYISEELRAELKEFTRSGGLLLQFRMDCEKTSLIGIRDKLEEMGEARRLNLNFV